jgi:hypothetical protein
MPTHDSLATASVVNPELHYIVDRLRHGIPADQVKPVVAAVLRRHLVGEQQPTISKVPTDRHDAVMVDLQVELTRFLVTLGPIFPLPPDGKFPYGGSHGHLDAVQDMAKIRQWIEQHPNCNWGITRNVIDVDHKPDEGKLGRDTWQDILDEYADGFDPDTLMVSSPSGGFHVYVDNPLPNKTNTLGPGVDTRGAGKGYVVAPGSHTKKGFYSLINNEPIASLPWIGKIIARADSEFYGERGLPAIVECDTPEAIEQAIELLQFYASSEPEWNANGHQIKGPAIQGKGGDDWTVEVAMRVGDLGISRETCLDLMFEHFNDACVPPWGNDMEGATNDRLSTKVNSSYNSRQTPPGSNAPGAVFAESAADLMEEYKGYGRDDPPPPKPEPEPEPKAPIAFAFRNYALVDPSTIPPRDWLYGKHFIRGYVVADVSPGGGGKTSHDLVEAVSMAAGTDLLNGGIACRVCRVFYWNGEDPREEVERRLAAIVKHYSTADDTGEAELDADALARLKGNLFIESGRDVPIKLATRLDRSGVAKVAVPVVEGLIAEITAKKIDVVMIDPFVSSHALGENDNNDLDKLVKDGWGRVCKEGHCCVNLIHHSRKVVAGAQIGAADARGASSTVDAARDVRVFNPMTKEEAQEMRISIEDRWRFFKVTSDKSNMTARAGSTPWRYMASIKLGNATDDLPGDDVGVVTAWDVGDASSAGAEFVQPDNDDAILRAAAAWIKSGQTLTKQNGPNALVKVAPKIRKTSGFPVLTKGDLERVLEAAVAAGTWSYDKQPGGRVGTSYRPIAK